MKKIIATILVICILTLFFNTYLSYQRYNRYLESNVKKTNDQYININDIYKYRLMLKEFTKEMNIEWISFWEKYESYINYGYKEILKEDLYRVLNNIKNIRNNLENLKVPKGDEYISNKINKLMENISELIYQLEMGINKGDQNKIKKSFNNYKKIKEDLINLIKLLKEPVFYEI